MLILGKMPNGENVQSLRAMHDFPNNHISRCGDVWKRINHSHPERRQWVKRKAATDKDGYLRVALAGKNYLVHRLVYRAFVGDLIDGLVVCHLNGNKQDNRPENLLQSDQKTNISHKREHGTWQIGDTHPRSLADNELAAQVKRLIQSAPRSASGRIKRGFSRMIADQAGVSIHLVYSINNGKRWVP